MAVSLELRKLIAWIQFYIDSGVQSFSDNDKSLELDNVSTLSKGSDSELRWTWANSLSHARNRTCIDYTV